MRKFGKLLRKTREEAGASMGMVARHLGMKVSHLSDVELERRAPLSPERIRRVAAMLQLSDAQTDELLMEAAAEKGVFEFDTENVSQRAREVVAALARELPALDDQQLDYIAAIVNRAKGG